MKRVFKILYVITLAYFMSGCGNKKDKKPTSDKNNTRNWTNDNDRDSSVEYFNYYEEIGVYNKHESKLDINMRMIDNNEESEGKIKIDLQLCGYEGDTRFDLTFNGTNPFGDKYISGCNFFDNYAYFICCDDEIFVDAKNYDLELYKMVNTNIFKPTKKDDELFILSLATGNVYNLTNKFEEIDVSNRKAVGNEKMFVKATKNGSQGFYLIEEGEDDIIDTLLSCSPEPQFMDKYDNIYYGGDYYIGHMTLNNSYDLIELDTTTTTWGSRHYGLNINNECYYCECEAYDFFAAPVAYKNGFTYGKYDDQFEFGKTGFGYLNGSGEYISYNVKDLNDLRWKVASCAIYDMYFHNSYIIDDVLYTPVGVYNILYSENEGDCYILDAIVACLYVGIPNENECGANLNGAICRDFRGFYDRGRDMNEDVYFIYDKEVINECVEDYKEKLDKYDNFRDYYEYGVTDYKMVDKKGIWITKVENKLIGKEIVVYFEGTLNDEYCWGYFDEKFEIVIGGYDLEDDYKSIIMHKTRAKKVNVAE